MRKRLQFLLVFAFPVFTFGQTQVTIDSLRLMLQRAKTDSARIWALHEIAHSFMYTYPDSSMSYAQSALGLAKKAHYSTGEIRGLNDVGNIMTNTSNYVKAQQIFFEALKKAEETDDGKMKATTLGNISENYMNQGDFRQAIQYTMRSLKIDLAAHDSLYILYDYLNLGDYYEQNKQPDSALIFENQAYQSDLKIKDIGLMESILMAIGNIQSQLKNDDLALPFYKKAISVNNLTENSTMLSKSCYGLAELYDRSGKTDSALFYFNMSYLESKKASYQVGMLKASSKLSSLFENTNRDSTLKYLKLSVAIKDSVFNQEKIRQAQSSTFAEQLRQNELEELRVAQHEERMRNLQLAGIGVFIPIFFGLVLLLGRRKTKPRTIEFMGLLGLLLFFEFISLLVHPYILKWTHDIPVLMLLILVGIAALLVPTHHRLQHWVKEKLAH